MIEKRDDTPGDDLLDGLDDLLEGGEAPRTAKERFRRKAQTEGLDIAYTALVEVLNDSKAPAPARATAGGLMLRAAGIFSKRFEEEGDSGDGGLDDATQDELAAMLKLIRAKDHLKRARLSKSKKATTTRGEDEPSGGGGSDGRGGALD